MTAALHWISSGLKESAAMVWMTWWPLVFGFTLSGLVQSFLPRDGLRHQLGADTPTSAAKASLLGAISSSCSYAASAMARALFARGASWSNALIFMVASTNLVIELGVVLYLLLGWQFVVAQIAGGVVMILALFALTRVFFSRPRQESLRARVLADSPAPPGVTPLGWRQRIKQRRSYSLAAQYTLGDVTMLRKELVAGFVVAGFLTVHVPALWWSHLFFSGHGTLTVVENAIVAPLLAVVSFVCSVGNIPLAAALWFHGVAFGGVVSFIFADLVTFPLLLIYRRFYGTSSATRLFALLWLVMSGGGLLIEVLFGALHLLAHNRHSVAMQGQFPLGWTLGLNVVATLALATLWLLARHGGSVARDPICHMTVDLTAPVASRRRDGHTYYFCSLRCAARFDDLAPDHTRGPNLHRDPVCDMVVGEDALHAVGRDGVTYYFCSETCRSKFLADPEAADQQRSGEVIP
jgi:YHS domain-containing protein/uncharacterized membrane protein YraQ (UPF0718 family)